MRVILCRNAGAQGRLYCRRWELPVVPFPGLGVCLEPGEPAESVEEVWVTAGGEVVVELEAVHDGVGGGGWVCCKPWHEAEDLAAAEARVVSEDDGEPE